MVCKTTLTRDTFINLGRMYFRSIAKKLYCQDADGTWYFCSRDGEPQDKVDVTITRSYPPKLDVLIKFL